ncbi:unnamed protein product [Kluyveromyces dobzhanskii CBS 2104]|uniref:Ubiquitin carboxyl-terminal hydrolase 2 n=1 Tax=Kluyveromyces dobzhanskii CBS 2104 TaxID=1427455 RepID=A0A0A8L7U4_9SACH|nr:unnamed protein product [Kluyveromyces dobzhanskii CBS 2104]
MASQQPVLKLKLNLNQVDSAGQPAEESKTDIPDSLTELVDEGKALLYPEISNNFPFKTCDRILDDIRISPWFLKKFGSSVLKQPMLQYSRERQQLKPWNLVHLIDQVNLKSRYDYDSMTCPGRNTISVMFALLVDPNFVPDNFDDITQFPEHLYHLKVTVKRRSHLESFNRHVGVTHYHLLEPESLHPFDKKDIFIMDKTNPRLVDQSVFVSTDTNKLIVVEIIKPEFDSNDLSEYQSERIKERYAKACHEFDLLNPDDVPTQAVCLKTLFMIFKNPLQRKSDDSELKIISKDSVALNSQINTEWLTSKFNFNLQKTSVEDNVQSGEEFKPPNLVDYVTDFKVREIREGYIRKSMEVILIGKQSMFLENDLVTEKKTVAKCFSNQHFGTTHTWWFNIMNHPHMEPSTYDTNYHFINLSVAFRYIDKDIIKNYETQIALDPENIGHYFDALQYATNAKGSYQLIAYCGKQDVVGYDDLNNALQVFGLDPTDVDVNLLDGNTMIEYYNSNLLNCSEIKRKDLRNALRVLGKHLKNQKMLFLVEYEPYITVQQAYNLLKVDETVDDDIIQTAYTINIADMPGLKKDYDRAIFTIALDRRSMFLFNVLTEECPEFAQFYSFSELSYDDALKVIEIDMNASDDVILEVFQRKWNHGIITGPDYLLKLKMALQSIGTTRNSKLINHFLETGIVDVSCLPVATWPAGINNVGNTCYLNSLLQFFFTIKPLRISILNYDSDSARLLEESKFHSKRRIGGREVSKQEELRSIQFIYHLRDLFNDMIRTNSRCVTPTKELVYLAFAPSNVEVEFADDSSTEKELIDLTTDSVENLDDTPDLKSSEDDISMGQSPEALPVSVTETAKEQYSVQIAKISADQLENTLEIGRQQDVTECIGNVFAQIEIASEPLSLEDDYEQNDLVKQLFYGRIKQDLIPKNDETSVRTKYERFLSLLVNIGDHPKDIYDALDSYFQNDYLNLAEYGDVKRTVSISELPAVLQIQIQRVYYDREKFMPFKSIEPLPFNETLYMDRYMTTDNSELLKEIKRSTALKQELKELKQHQRKLLSQNEIGLSFKSSLIETKKFLESNVIKEHEIDTNNLPSSIAYIDTVINNIDKELERLFRRITDLENEVSQQFQQFKDIGYSLFAVFIHRGEASYGHYWVYIKDHTRNGIWRKYNDDSVTEVPQSEVFNFTDGNTATPYFLVYVREGQEQETVEPLKRILQVD